MPGPWIDAHCHLADPRFDGQLDAIALRSRAAGVVSWLQGGVGPDDWDRQRQVRRRLGPQVRIAFGLHPWWVSTATDAEVDGALERLEAEVHTVSAIGELGMDLHPRRTEPNGAEQRQRRAFEAQLALAIRVPRLLVLHVVRAHHVVLASLARLGPFPRGGLVHAFTGSLQDAKRYVDLGFHLSLGGGLVGRAKRAQALAEIPVDRVVIETDAPDQAPRGWQVPHNEPAYLPRIAEELAPIWGLSGTELLDQSRITLETLLSS